MVRLISPVAILTPVAIGITWYSYKPGKADLADKAFSTVIQVLHMMFVGTTVHTLTPFDCVEYEPVVAEGEGAVAAVIQTIQMGVPMARIEYVDAWSIGAVNAWAKMSLPEKPHLFVEFHGSATEAQRLKLPQRICLLGMQCLLRHCQRVARTQRFRLCCILTLRRRCQLRFQAVHVLLIAQHLVAQLGSFLLGCTLLPVCFL